MANPLTFKPVMQTTDKAGFKELKVVDIPRKIWFTDLIMRFKNWMSNLYKSWFYNTEEYYPKYPLLSGDNQIQEILEAITDEHTLDEHTAHIVIDPQNDFVNAVSVNEPEEELAKGYLSCSGFYKKGSLAVHGARKALAISNTIMGKVKEKGGFTVCTGDWHPKNHSSFAPAGTTYEHNGETYVKVKWYDLDSKHLGVKIKPDVADGITDLSQIDFTEIKPLTENDSYYVLVEKGALINYCNKSVKEEQPDPFDSSSNFQNKNLKLYEPQKHWPAHCVQGSDGAEFCSEIEPKNIDFTVSKGVGITEAYSAITDQAGNPSSNLNEVLDFLIYKKKVTKILISGLATDYCVMNTALDIAKKIADLQGVQLFFIQQASAGIDLKGCQSAIEEMTKHDIKVISADALSSDDSSLESKGTPV